MDTTRKIPAYDKQPLAGIRILLVEDEFDVANLLLFLLNNAGADVTWVTCSAEALAQLKEFHPDILISNVKLPDHNADWLIQKIRQAELGNRPHLPALAITSYTREFSEKKMLEAGFEQFLPKDFDAKQLVSTILNLV